MIVTLSSAKVNSNIDSNNRIGKENIAEIFQRMCSEIMTAFTEVAEMKTY